MRLRLWGGIMIKIRVDKSTYHPVTCVGELDQFGLHCLTGEHDMLSLRMLFDVTQDGKELIERVLGVHRLELAPRWNSITDTIGSISLIHGMTKVIAIDGFLHAGAREVWEHRHDGSIHPLWTMDEVHQAIDEQRGGAFGQSFSENWRRYSWRGLVEAYPKLTEIEVAP